MSYRQRASTKSEPTGRRSRPRRTALAVAMLTLASLLGLASPTPAEAQVDPPILVIGGFGVYESSSGMQAWLTELNNAGYDAHVMQLESLFGGGLTPGWARMERQGWAVEDKVDEILDNTSATTIQLVGISQGALAAREYINKLGGTSTVNSLVSFAGVNGGISYENEEMPMWSSFLEGCYGEGDVDPWLPICAEMIFGSLSDPIGGNDYLEELNGIDPAGDPTPGNIDYYHICSDTADPVEAECYLPPGHSFTKWTAQDKCPGAGPIDHGDASHPVMQELIWAAIEGRQPVCP